MDGSNFETVCLLCILVVKYSPLSLSLSVSDSVSVCLCPVPLKKFFFTLHGVL